MKKLIIMFLTSIFITLSIQTFTSAYTLVSTQKVTIYVGDKKQLNTWKNNVKWSVSDKDCVSMSQTGSIQAYMLVTEVKMRLKNVPVKL